MKRYLFYIIAASALVSCADNEMTSIYKDEPDSLAQTDYLKKYGPLRDYTDMSVGTTVSPNVYDATDLNYRMLCANFNEVQPEGLFTHGSMVQADGTISTASADAFLDAAVRANQNVFAGPLTSHQGQNIDYLNNLIKPTVHSKDGSPLTSYCIVATNTIEGEAKSQQFEFAFTRTPAVTPQLEYDLVFYVRGTRSGSISLSVAGGSDFTPKVAVTTEWKKVTVHTVMRSGIYNLRSLVFNIGAYVGTLYIDNFELYEIDEYGDRSGNKMKDSSFNANLDNAEATADGLTKVDGISNGITQLGISALGDGYDPNTYTVEKTDEEKKEILTAALNNWLTGVVSACGSRVCGWDVLSMPNSIEPSAADFYWQNYLGLETYAAQAFKTVRQTGGEKLFIADRPDKAEQMIQLVNSIEQQGAQVDGYDLMVFSDTNLQQALSSLVATGKLIRLSAISLSKASDYQTLLQSYMQNVPAQQRYGFCLKSMEPLWTADYNRTQIYGVIADSFY